MKEIYDVIIFSELNFINGNVFYTIEYLDYLKKCSINAKLIILTKTKNFKNMYFKSLTK